MMEPPNSPHFTPMRKDDLKRLSTEELLRYVVRLEHELTTVTTDRARLADLEHNFRQIAHLSCDYGYIHEFKEDGTITPVWSFGGFSTITGYTPDELTTLGGWPTLIHTEDFPPIQKHIGLLMGGAPSVVEARIVCKDGSIKWIRDTSIPWQDATGKTIGAYGSAREITQEKNNQQALERQERSFLSMVNTPALHAIFRMEHPTTPTTPVITHVSPSLKQILGIAEEDLWVFERWLTHVHPADRPTIDEALQRSFSPPFSFDETLRYNHPVRGTMWLHVQAQGVPTAHDPERLDFASGVLMDVTQLKLVRAQLEAAEWERSMLMDSMVEPFIFLGTDQHLKWCNRAAEHYLGRTLSELSGTSCKNLFCDAPSNCADCPVRTAEESGTEASVTRTLADGVSWQINVRPLYDPSAALQGYSFLCRNISSEVAGAAARKELEAQLLQAQKLESIGRLAGGIAHEFNNLMSPVLGYSELLLDEVPLDPEYKEMILEIKNSAMQASLVTSRLLTFSKKKRPAKKPLRVVQILEETVALLKGTLSETITIHTHYFDETLQIEFDPTQFQQMILNLAINAQDAMPRGGALTIEVASAAESELPALTEHHSNTSAWVKIAVSDTGEGIAPENLAKVFDPFYTTRDRTRGTGLGLAMVHGVVEQHDGVITVKSTPAEGTLFTLFVPRYSPHSQGDGAPIPHPASRGTILLVEDDPSLAKMAQTILRRDNYTVIVATSGSEALQFAMRPTARIDLLITDIVIPDMDGFKIAESLRSRIPELKVLYMSGHAEHIIAHEALSTAAEGFLQKPFTLKAFKTKISTFLPGHID